MAQSVVILNCCEIDLTTYGHELSVYRKLVNNESLNLKQGAIGQCQSMCQSVPAEPGFMTLYKMPSC